jgi:HAD superfamily hydrolase (TIGR01509 family)
MTMPHLARALLFDMDGLAVDSEPLWFRVERDFARERGGEFTEAMARSCVGRGMAHTMGFMRTTLGLAVDVERDAQTVIDRFIARVGELSLKPGFVELLEDARSRGVPRALASSSARRLVAATLDRFGLAPSFDAVVSGDCVAHPKPAPDIFLEAARRLGVAPQGCVVLEDSESGCRAGRAAGMVVIAVPEHAEGAARGDGVRERFHVLADAVVTDLHEARRILTFV